MNPLGEDVAPVYPMLICLNRISLRLEKFPLAILSLSEIAETAATFQGIVAVLLVLFETSIACPAQTSLERILSGY